MGIDTFIDSSISTTLFSFDPILMLFGQDGHMCLVYYVLLSLLKALGNTPREGA